MRKIQCDICEEILPSEDYESHRALHDPEDRVVCRQCGKQFSNLRQHRDHAQDCFSCPLCLRNFSRKNSLLEHLCDDLAAPFLCVCDQAFRHFKDIIKHAKGPILLHCCSCDHTTTSFTSLTNHLKNHPKNFECPVCGEFFASASALQDHGRKKHKVKKTTEPTRKCPHCDKSFKLNRIKAHLLKHTLTSCLCPECGKMFVSHCRLTQHLLATHYAEPVTCDICKKVLKTKKILSEHLKTHWKTQAGTRVAQAVCPRCGLELAQKGSLSRHITLVHERHRLKKDDKPRVCKECKMVLPGSSQYYTHMRQHRAEKERFPCECGREFNKKQNLLRHINLIHNKDRAVRKRSSAQSVLKNSVFQQVVPVPDDVTIKKEYS